MAASLKLLSSTFHPAWLLQGRSLASTLQRAVVLPGSVAVHQSHTATAQGECAWEHDGVGWGLRGLVRAGWGPRSYPQHQAGCPHGPNSLHGPTPALELCCRGARAGVTWLHPTLAWPAGSRGLLMEGHSEAINPPSEAAAHTLVVKKIGRAHV